MIKRLLLSSFVLLCTCSVLLVLNSNSSGPANAGNGGRTGAPGDGTCGNCHSGGVYGTVTPAIQVTPVGGGAAVTSYTPGTTYQVTVTVTSSAGTPVRYGFQLTSLRTSNNGFVGSFSNLGSNVRQSVSGARTYVEQQSASTTNSFTFRWTAPAAGTGQVRLYAAGNCVNGTGGTSGDNTGISNLTLSEAITCTTLSVNGTVTPTSASSNTGAISTTLGNGTAPFTYSWSNGATTANINNLAAGTYNVTVTDFNGCTGTYSGTVTVQLSVSLNPAIGIICSGSTFTTVASATGSTGPYSYAWSNGATGANFSVSPASTTSYTVTATSSTGATASNSITVNVSGNPTLLLTTTGNATQVCPGGTIGINAVSNASNYVWSTGATTQSITVGAGQYCVTVTNNNGCTTTACSTIGTFSVPGLTINGSTDVCPGSTTSLTAAAGFNSYSWSNGATTSSISIGAGTYSLTATTANGCTATQSATVNQFNAFSVGLVAQSTSCGGTNGSVTANVSPAGTYTYLWSNGATSAAINNLSGGIYSVTVTDANGCTQSGSETVGNTSTLSLLPGQQSTTCVGSTDGAALVTVSGGTSPYTYTWSNGATGAAITGLAAGNYTVTVQDAQGCNSFASVDVLSPAPIQGIQTISGPSCFGLSDGSWTLVVSGGTAPYTYDFGAGATTVNVFSNLAAGNYTCTVTDASACTATFQAELTQASEITLNATVIDGSGGNLGSISLNVTGGVAPYNYQWTNGSTSANQTDLVAGVYDVTVTDANGCTMSDSYTVEVLGSTSLLPAQYIKLYPNPVAQYMNLELDPALGDKVQIQVLGVDGKLYLDENYLNTGLIQVNSALLPSGNYQLRIISEAGFANRTFLKN